MIITTESLVCPNVRSCAVYEWVYRGIEDKPVNVIQKSVNGDYFCSALKSYYKSLAEKTAEKSKMIQRETTTSLEDTTPDCLNLKLLNDRRNDVRLQA